MEDEEHTLYEYAMNVDIDLTDYEEGIIYARDSLPSSLVRWYHQAGYSGEIIDIMAKHPSEEVYHGVRLNLQEGEEVPYKLYLLASKIYIEKYNECFGEMNDPTMWLDRIPEIIRKQDPFEPDITNPHTYLSLKERQHLKHKLSLRAPRDDDDEG